MFEKALEPDRGKKKNTPVLSVAPACLHILQPTERTLRVSLMAIFSLHLTRKGRAEFENLDNVWQACLTGRQNRGEARNRRKVCQRTLSEMEN